MAVCPGVDVDGRLVSSDRRQRARGSCRQQDRPAVRHRRLRQSHRTDHDVDDAGPLRDSVDFSSMPLTDYVTLGRSGLRVSPFCLGTMTFGEDWGWGNDAATAGAILDRYLEAGGNFLDTADGYTMGRSEKLLGTMIAARKARDRVGLARKFTVNAEPGNPNAGG